MTTDSPGGIDHLVYAVPDLDEGIARMEALTGVRAAAGGAHPQWGTANALVSLGPDVYLEIIGPDPGQPAFRGQRVFRVDSLDEPRLVTWAAKGRQLEALSAITLPNGERIGRAFPASRRQPDGSLLEWTLTDPTVTIADGLVPFFIDWGNSPHPAAIASAGLRLTSLQLEHPDPAAVQPLLDRLGLTVPILAGDKPALRASLQTPKGEVILR